MKQKRVLMITRSYYPSNSSGVHRPAGYAKYLPSFGWLPLVVCKQFTPSNSGGTYDEQLAQVADCCEVVRVGARGNTQIISRVQDTFWTALGGGIHDYRNPYLLYRKMRAASESIVRNRGIDALWSTSMPGLDHRIANYLSRKYSIPWVADFRDLPDQTYVNRRTLHVVKQEMETCSCAKAIIAVTEELRARLSSRHKVPTYTIYNGFDEQEYQGHIGPAAQSEGFTINHFGWLYEFRDPAPLFQAIDTLHQAGRIDMRDVHMNFFGANEKIVDRFARSYKCASQVNAVERLPYHRMIERQKQSQVLLLVAPRAQGGAIPAKVFSYLASQRPILSVPGDEAGTDSILAETQAGVTFSSAQHIAPWLERQYLKWKRMGTLPFSGDQSVIRRYSRRSQTSDLADVLNVICS